MLSDEDCADCSIQNSGIAAFEPCRIKSELSLITLSIRHFKTSESNILQCFCAQIRLYIAQVLKVRVYFAVCIIQACGKSPVRAGFQFSSTQSAKRSRRFRIKSIDFTEIDLVVRRVQPLILLVLAKEAVGEPLCEEGQQ